MESLSEYIRETVGPENAGPADALISKLGELAQAHPAPKEEINIPTAPGVVTQVVEDAITLKSNLAPSKAATPTKTWAEYAADGSRANL